MEKTISPIFMEMAAALLNNTEEDFGKVAREKIKLNMNDYMEQKFSKVFMMS